MPKAITFAQFHEAIGSAVTTWAAVEDAFCDLFTRLVICSVTGSGILASKPVGLWVVPSIFHSSNNLRSKTELIDRIFRRLITDEALIAEWESIHDKSRRLYSRRNVMAHGHVWGNHEGASCVAYALHADSRRMNLSYQQVCAATPSFRKYRDRIEALAIEANKLLATRIQSGSKDFSHQTRGGK